MRNSDGTVQLGCTPWNITIAQKELNVLVTRQRIRVSCTRVGYNVKEDHSDFSFRWKGEHFSRIPGDSQNVILSISICCRRTSRFGECQFLVTIFAWEIRRHKILHCSVQIWHIPDPGWSHLASYTAYQIIWRHVILTPSLLVTIRHNTITIMTQISWPNPT